MNKAKIIFSLSFIGLAVSSCTNQAGNTENSKTDSTNANNKGLYKVVVYYPKTDSTKFDMDYYVNNHMSMMVRILGSNLHDYEIDNGGADSNPNAPYVAAGSFYIEDIKQFADSVYASGDSFGKDIPNYTNVSPVLQTFTIKRFGK
ncbi:EthD family reductase [Sphingobacterium endophyticum]|uniref:EthD family reductase n=1 Tax=Sphingobacterium endophyticum TaxID=2546448 RepID=UPI0012E30395|nr:EthD family reductase [Sphingobacterium endophyticum]